MGRFEWVVLQTHYLFTDGQSSSVDSNAEGFAQTVTFNRSESGMLSYVGRVNYSYDD